jgi:hypothetical protein
VDKSAWWVPNVYAGDTELKAAKIVEYDQITRDLPQSEIKPFPRGFEAIARNPQFRCGNGEFKTAMNTCSADTFDARLDFNQCFNPNDAVVESNLVKPLSSRCPSTHPVLLPQIQVQLTYRMPAGSPDGPITVAGTTGDHMDETSFHADFIHVYDTQADYVDLMKKCLTLKQDERRPDVCRTSDNA